MLRLLLIFICLGACAQDRTKPVLFINWDMERYGDVDEKRTARSEVYHVNQLLLESTPKLLPVTDPPEEVENGPSGQALFFDGKQNQPCRSIYRWNTKRAFDMRFWIRPARPEPIGSQTVFDMPRAWEVAWKDGQLHLHIFFRNKNTTLTLPCEADVWSEVFISYRTTGEIVLKVDGQEAKKKLSPGDEMNKVDLPIRVGANSFRERPFRGYIDNVNFQSIYEKKRGNPITLDKKWGDFL